MAVTHEEFEMLGGTHYPVKLTLKNGEIVEGYIEHYSFADDYHEPQEYDDVSIDGYDLLISENEVKKIEILD